MEFLSKLKLRWKLLALVLPLVIGPIFIVAGVIGSIANHQAYLGITQTSKDDLQHITAFTIDLLNSHYQQFQVYKQDKIKNFNSELATLTNLSYNLVESEHKQYKLGRLDLAAAKREARDALKKVNVGETGYIYAMTSHGDLKVHIAREGENVYNEKDENGRYFIREMCETAKLSKPGEVLFIIYPWRNAILGDKYPRKKVVAYRYFREWDWIIAAGGYLDETYDEAAFERKSFAELKEKIKAKKVGSTGYIFCMDSKGTFTIHPDSEGMNFFDARDSNGFPFIREMCEKKSGWIRYPWKNVSNSEPRMKIVRYAYFKPWDWIVAVGSYEDEFYHEANKIKDRIMISMVLLSLLVGLFAVALVFRASTIITSPITHMIDVIRRVKRGNLEERMKVEGQDELAELAGAFNRMTDIIRRNKEMEASLAQHGKMASLGVLSSGVAHEINNPLGVILGYAGYLEGKMTVDDPNYKYIHEIKRESKRCKKIVQDLLSYARTPRPSLEPVDLNDLLAQIADFAANHTDMRGVTIRTEFAPDLPKVHLDGDQMRQVAINLILNAGGAMPDGGSLTIRSEAVDPEHVRMVFSDSGCGIPAENLEKIFEPFYTTKERGTGLGLAITRQIIEQHHGEISIVSGPDTGTTVTVTLPVERDEL
ncbi:cache domain-containing protein [Geobacter sp. AOG2]|uniref:cache domain-containing protein n=1 Tax=Geobacter sp. AOG2 TaxID=1566347 RepID=UPI001CC46316|nr:cache domain-containing protein [Geobacter sp. AOG2]GFE60451.1 histidine kinase [Geobacter sp. AOG2]